jgi:predicted phage baseplate assembly protein
MPPFGILQNLAMPQPPGPPQPSATPKPFLFAKVGASLLYWDALDGNTDAKQIAGAFRDLVPIQNVRGALLAIGTLIDQGSTKGYPLLLKRPDQADFIPYGKPADLPAGPLTAWTDDPSNFARIYLAGYGTISGAPWIMLARVQAGGASTILQVAPARDFLALPLGFEAPQAATAPPTLVAALNPPTRFIASSAKGKSATFRTARETEAIGGSARTDRILLAGSGRTLVQRPDSGLLYRSGEGSGERSYPAAPAFAVAAAGLPAGNLYAAFANAALTADGFALDDEIAGWRLLKALPGQDPDAVDDRVKLLVEADQAKAGAVTISGTISLFEGPALAPTAPATPGGGKEAAPAQGTFLNVDDDEIDVLISIAGELRGIWHLTRSSRSKGSWKKPAGFPDPTGTSKTPPPSVTYQLLSAQPTPVAAARLAVAEVPATEQADFGGLLASLGPGRAPGLIGFRNDQAILGPSPQLADGEVRISQPVAPWRILGPGAAANPTLSWEYWNGESWWALGNRDLRDDTANFQTHGGVFFKAPADIRPTDVGGTTRYWIRARLVGGDYGEPTTIVTSRPGANGGTEQAATRDLSAVRAPYITALRLGYCASEPVRPEIVLTEDSLGTIDQTSANEAGLQFPVFTPVATLMNPVSAAAATAEATAVSASCEDPCPPPAPPPPSPCDAPGAYASCDSPCLDPSARGAGAAGEAGFVRGLMIGFSKPFAGETVSLYIDAEPSGAPVELRLDILRGGRFVAADLVTDTSYGLTESGILTLALPGPPDLSDLFGASAYWLRLRPKAAGSVWAPRLRGLHLNAVLSSSVETHRMEQLGQSIGVADQLFQLSEPPVDPRTLELRVRELLGDEERADPALDVATYAAGPAGEWMLWTLTEDLVESGPPQRVYTLDAEGGGIRFGNGATGRIPPLGADIVAVRYAHISGRKANAVAPGQQLQTLSPLAGVEKVVALDAAAGGSDAEALDSARRRAAAKVRHGGRILSRADLEDHAATLAPDIAQVRADRKGGAVRLIMVMAGAEPRPSPAQLRGFAAAIRAVSGFGLAREGGLAVVAPRLLPLAVRLVLRPLSPDSFAEAAAEAKAALAALLDPATGNHDGKGWPLGRLPEAQDVAAALAAIESLALPEQVVLERADRELAAERALPASLPPDVLVRLDSVALERAREVAA